MQPSIRHLTPRWPLPRDWARTVGAHPHCDHPTGAHVTYVAAVPRGRPDVTAAAPGEVA